ncbi:MAG: hypothetical protein AAF840_10780, partial [Bacteroidota bacterium]
MRIKRWLWLLSVCFLTMSGLSAQQRSLSNLRDTVLLVNPAGQLVDSLTVVPQSFRLYDANTLRLLPASTYELTGRFLQWRVTELPDSVRATYRILPFTIDATARLLDSSQLIQEEAGLVIGGYDDYIRSGLLDNDGKVRT